MSYVIYLISGHEVEITDKEYGSLNGKTGLVHFRSADEVVNMSSVSHIVESSRATAIRFRTATSGRLHDGTLVVRRFGQWVDADNPEVHLNRQHYSEIARDEVIPEDIWQREVECLPVGRRPAAVGDIIDRIRVTLAMPEDRALLSSGKGDE